MDKPVFALMVRMLFGPRGGYAIEAKSHIPDEIKLTLIRNWLRKEEDKYHDEFKRRSAA